MTTIKLSLVTATWNSGNTIADTLRSLAQQTFQNYEAIIIDGGSTDDTLKVARNSGVNIAHMVSERDKGIYDALNKGIALSSGDYVGFLHSDDVLAGPNALKHLAERLICTRPDAIYADLQYVDKFDTEKVIRYWKSGSFERDRMRYGWMPPHPTFYMRRELYEKFGAFNLNYKISADYDSLVRYLWANDISIDYLPEVLVKMRVGGASNRSIANIIRKSKEDVAVMKCHKLPLITGLMGKNFSKIPQFFMR